MFRPLRAIIKITNAKQTKTYNQFKNTKEKHLTIFGNLWRPDDGPERPKHVGESI
jgi:hypothetical protein